MAHPLETIWNSLINKKVETEDFIRASMNPDELNEIQDRYYPGLRNTEEELQAWRNWRDFGKIGIEPNIDYDKKFWDWRDGGGDFTDTGVSSARHQAAASNVSDAVADKLWGSGFLGDATAFAAGLRPELRYINAVKKDGFTDATRRLKADLADNWIGAFGTPYGSTAEDIFKENMGGLTAEQYREQYYIDKHMNANNIWR